MSGESALIAFPIAFEVKSHLQETVLRIMSFLAAGTNEVTPPIRALTIVVFGDGESQPATAGNQEHPQRLLVALVVCFSRLGCSFHYSSTVAYALLLRLFA